MRSKLVLWLQITRPGTLAAALSPVLIGLITVAYIHPIHLFVAFTTLIAALSLQIASNFINDYYDYKKGTDKAGRIGFKRALAENLVSIGQMKLAIYIDLFIAVLCGIYLVYVGGIPILLIGIFAILFAWLYTATSYSLSYLGIADLFVFVFFGPVAVGGTYYLQTGYWSLDSMLVGCICGFISMAVLTVNNLRDRKSDAESGKKSLIVRYGKKFGELEYLILYLLAIPCLYFTQHARFSYLITIVGIFLYTKLKKAKGKEYNKMLVITGLSNVVFLLLYFVDYILFS